MSDDEVIDHDKETGHQQAAERTCEMCGDLATTKVIDVQETYPEFPEDAMTGIARHVSCEPRYFCDAHERPPATFPRPWMESARYYREMAGRRDGKGDTERGDVFRAIADRYEARDLTVVR